jgi:hypothetical protein
VNFNNINSNIFEGFHKILEKNKFEPQNMYKADGTEVGTLQAPYKIMKQVGLIACSKSGALVTVCVSQ